MRGPRQRQIEHLVEVAVIEVAAPVDRDEAAAHHAVEVVVAMGLAQQAHVAVELALRDQGRAEPLDRHVGKREQAVEFDSEFAAELAPVVGFERLLRRRQRRALRVVDEFAVGPQLHGVGYFQGEPFERQIEAVPREKGGKVGDGIEVGALRIAEVRQEPRQHAP